ncbi:hypothetical protein ACIRP3_19075 [Streptomyces sp. NPDC101209]|uniref:hypothetical protein n=1 Tax=Streptomyces sp. NPDC101209 TaxID=3366129 RepID=UPI00381AD7C5
MVGRLRRPTWRRTTNGPERDVPRRLRDDIDQALSLADGAARRAAVDGVVRGITEGRYGSGFQRRAEGAQARTRQAGAR